MRDLQDLGALVQWTRRTDYYTLQIVAPVAPVAPVALSKVLSDSIVLAGSIESQTTREVPKPVPVTQVWLLRADGTVIPPLRSSSAHMGRLDSPSVEDTFAFAISEGARAVAVAVMVNGHYSIGPLAPFPDQKN